jgi:hypothetical protein
MIIYGNKTGKTIILLSTHSPDLTTDIARAKVGRPALPKMHRHIGIVDPFGDGVTSVDEGHRHKIKDGMVVAAREHGHEQVHYE